MNTRGAHVVNSQSARARTSKQLHVLVTWVAFFVFMLTFATSCSKDNDPDTNDSLQGTEYGEFPRQDWEW